ncbi:hypothetical protein Y032_0107g3799 [Ancylostoma ceylanicum]|uniref:Uncharacterized protein n=1 Tax=Ancylostoma ceylanicum TaxID=53326 RepID=A0A016TFK1_9BILA|nr:hypothetical protein Y032_0107g3799 [Ancylostoma ceylanicum]
MYTSLSFCTTRSPWLSPSGWDPSQAFLICSDDKYAPSPNAVPISPLPPSTTTTTVTTTPATTATTISSQVVEVATTILSSNESVATKTVDPRVHGNTERTVATTSTTAATVTLTRYVPPERVFLEKLLCFI